MSENKNECSGGKTPSAKWYQDNDSVFLTFCVEDCKNIKVFFDQTYMIFEGTGGSEHTFYRTKIVFLDDIVPKKSKYILRDREVEILLKKKESGPYWNRLVKCQAKQHWLTINFDKWNDEDGTADESDEEKKNKDELDDPRNGPPPLDFKKHISENVSKGSSLCPLGSAIMGKAMRLENDLNDLSMKDGGKAFDINGFDESAPDSDDEAISDLEEETDLS